MQVKNYPVHWTPIVGEPSDIPRTLYSLPEAGRVFDALDEADDATAVDPAWPQIDGYVVERELGSGAGGITYLAHKSGSESRVAIKVVRQLSADASESRRAWSELELLQRARSENVPRLLDFGRTGHSLYLVTEYIDGEPLHRWIDGRPRADGDSLRSTVRLLAAVCRAVQGLHERGVIHRDLKPSNIIVDSTGHPFIIDLGIAQLDERDPHEALTLKGQVLGTPAFMSPEQACGRREDISTRSDVYALGAVSYWLCTGQTPHDLSDATLHEKIRRVGTDPARDPRAISRAVPRPLAAVLAKACASCPTDRYGSAAGLADDLERWCDRRPVLATPPGVWRRGARWIERHPVGTTAIACCAILASTVGASLFSIAQVLHQPVAVVCDHDDRQWAALVTGAGHRVHYWRSPHGTKVLFAGEAVAPRRMGGGKLAVIAMAFADQEDILSRLRVYSFDDPDTPLWETPVSAPDILMPSGTEGWLDDSPEMRFTVQAAVVADIFPATTEHEIAVILNHRLKSASCLRIYSLDGEILAEAWHNGRINRVEWADHTQILVCGGVSDRPNLAEISPAGAESGYPIMVYGLLPESILALYSSQQPPAPVLLDSWSAQPAGSFAWTRTLWPPVLGQNYEPMTLRAEGGGLVQCHIGRTPLYTLGRKEFLIFEIDTHDGTSVFTPSDAFKALHPELVDHARLCDPTQVRRIPTR